MNTVKRLPEFDIWLSKLADDAVRAAVVARIARLRRGLPGDVAPIGDGVFELRIHLGAGWRIYFTQQGTKIIVLLAGGNKSSQKRDIKRAKALVKLLQ